MNQVTLNQVALNQVALNQVTLSQVALSRATVNRYRHSECVLSQRLLRGRLGLAWVRLDELVIFAPFDH